MRTIIDTGFFVQGLAEEVDDEVSTDDEPELEGES
jgi:hypothetical protein